MHTHTHSADTLMIIKPYMWSNVKQLFKDIFICVACCCDMGIVVLEYLNEEQVFNASVTADLQFAGWTTWKLTAVAAALVMQGGCSCKAGRVKGGQIDRQSEDRERGRERQAGRETGTAWGGVFASLHHRLQFWFCLKFPFSAMVFFVKSCQIVLSDFLRCL